MLLYEGRNGWRCTTQVCYIRWELRPGVACKVLSTVNSRNNRPSYSASNPSQCLQHRQSLTPTKPSSSQALQKIAPSRRLDFSPADACAAIILARNPRPGIMHGFFQLPYEHPGPRRPPTPLTSTTANINIAAACPQPVPSCLLLFVPLWGLAHERHATICGMG